MDKTFSHYSELFYQLFMIHTVNNGHFISLVIFLLPSKEIIICGKALKCLIDICEFYSLNSV